MKTYAAAEIRPSITSLPDATPGRYLYFADVPALTFGCDFVPGCLPCNKWHTRPHLLLFPRSCNAAV